MLSILFAAKPEWVSEPRKVEAGVGETAVFECSAEGRPAPRIQWFINGIPLECKYNVGYLPGQRL